MSDPQTAPTLFAEIANRALKRARRWADASNEYSMENAAKLLAGVLDDPAGLDYTVAFVDGVVRPEDKDVAASHLAKIGAQNPEFLPWYLRTPALVGGAVGKHLPTLSVPAARKVFARLVGDLVVDVTDTKLGPAIKRLKANGARLNMNLLGEAVLGEKEAARRLKDTLKLLKRDDVDYVSLKVSAVTGPHNAWGYEQVVKHAVQQLLPLYQYAAQAPQAKFINLDMEEYRDLNLTIDVFKQILDRDELLHLEAGIVLQAYLPDTLLKMQDLQQWAAARRARGGAGIKVRVVKGANLAMERVDALLHGWNLTTWESKQATDANYLRILDWAMQPERIANVRLGVAGHNLFTVAAAWELALERGVSEGVEIEMLSGMATQQALAVREDVGNLLLYVPVVHPAEYDVAIAYLVRRLEENSADANFMASIFDIGTNAESFEKEQQRFLDAVAQMIAEGDSRVGANRRQNRLIETAESLTVEAQHADGTWKFTNTADSDPAMRENLEWAKGIAQRIPSSEMGVRTAFEAEITDAAQLDRFIQKIRLGARSWAARSAAERAEVLHRVGVEISRRRADLIEVAGAELGKGLDQADVEVSEAADFAHYYAEQALELDRVNGATFKPVEVTLVTPPWNFPLAIPAGGVLAALAAGSGAILKPAEVSKRCGAVIAECLWAAGVPADAFGLVNVSEDQLGRELVTDERIGRVVLTGGAETAELFRSWDPTLRLMAETSGKNAIVVTPSADLDLAVKDIVGSAFGHAGQKCSACSYVILVGSAGFSKRVRNQIVDAVKSLKVGWADDLSAQMGPLSVEPGEKLLRGLTRLEPGQRWVVEPKPLDDSGRLWSPGVRAGVEVGSEYHLTEYFGPVLGIMRVDSLEEAILAQNLTDYGLTAGLHSLDAEEINLWLSNVEAGNVYVNRGITGAIVQRQPFGGWKRSVVGEGAKAGGPNYLFGFGDFAPAQLQPVASEVPLKEQFSELLEVAREYLSEDDLAALTEIVKHDALVTAEVFDALEDPAGISVERNILRYLPAETTLRFGAEASMFEVFRALSAAMAVGGFAFFADEDEAFARVVSGGGLAEIGLLVSASEYLPINLSAFLSKYGIVVVVENQMQFQRRLLEEHGLGERVRLIAEGGDELRRALGGSIDVAVWDGPLTAASRVEILPFVREQAVSVTNHRFGNRTPLSAEVLVAD